MLHFMESIVFILINQLSYFKLIPILREFQSVKIIKKVKEQIPRGWERLEASFRIKNPPIKILGGYFRFYAHSSN